MQTRYTSPPRGAAPDIVGVIDFNCHATIRLPLTSVNDPRALSRLPIRAGGTTKLDIGLRTAREMLANVSRGIIRRIVVISDGEPNCDATALATQAKLCRDSWVTVDSIFIGAVGTTGADTLAAISRSTVNGVAMAASTVHALRQSVLSRRAASHRRQGATVFLVDSSSSMSEALDGKTRMDAALDALQEYVAIKRVKHGGATYA